MIWVLIVGSMVVLLGIGVFFGAPYVPTRRQDARRLFEQGIKLGKKDVVLDLGSGDGVVLRELSRIAVKSVGYEIHPLFVLLSKFLSRNDANVQIKWANIWTRPFPEAVTLVYIFSVGRDAQRLIRKMQTEVDRLNRPVRLVCYGNPLPGKKPFQTFEAYTLYKFTPLHPKKA